jgi:hypothetical protein
MHSIDNWLIQNSRAQKKGCLNYEKKPYNSNKKVINLLKKIILVVSLWYVVACHAITVTQFTEKQKSLASSN